MQLLPFGKLPPFQPRQFVPAAADLGEWEQIAPLFDLLESRSSGGKTTQEFEQWLLEWSELTAALDEESSRRYIAMTCHTDDPGAEKAFLHFVENIEPRMKPRQFAIERIYCGHPQRANLPRPRFEIFDRDIGVRVELFRPENVPLETEEAKLGQQFQKLTGSLTVQYKGEEKTLPQMAPYLEQTDRAVREETWRLTVNRRLQEADKFEGQFEAMLALRETIANNAGFANYRDYAFRAKGRFDYTPKDCLQFHEAVEREFMPVVREIQAERRQQLKLATLRPWDLAVDPLNRPPLRPFEQVDQMVGRTQKIFDHLDSELAAGFRRMTDLKLLDLANRKGKAPGGYQASLNEARLPFIFMNAVGVQRDVETLLHEAGHAFHALATRTENLYPYRHAPLEFCEVASMSMELLGNAHIEEFYGAAEARRARRVHLEGIINFFPWMATVDAFQHWIYTHPAHSRAERTAAWVDLMRRFGGDVDWSGIENVRANLWHRQLHIFLHPFYYVEYGIAQIGALQVWAKSRQDKRGALDAYKQALALGGSRRLPELFTAAGGRFAFDRATVKPLVEMVRGDLAKLVAQ